MTLWIGNGEVLKSYSQWQKKNRKIDNSGHELFIFELPLTGTFKNCTITYP